MKRVLFIAYAFPPCGGAGVQRSAKFARYLPEHGWLPTVLTVDPSCYGVRDDSHVGELPGLIEVIRTAHVDPVVRFARSPVVVNGNGSNGNARRRGPSIKRVVRKLARDGWIAVDRNLLIPDAAVLWYPKAVSAGLRAAERNRFDLIYATGEPYSSYLVARSLSRRTGAPFVIDMRDPWTGESYRDNPNSALRAIVEQQQERALLSECGACIFAFRHSEIYDSAFPQWSSKFHYIPNGYDSADFSGVEPKRFEKLTIVHNGTFLPGYRTPATFLQALRRLLGEEPELAARLDVLFVGKLGEEGSLIRELSLEAVVRQIGYVPHQECMAYLKGADLLLLIGGPNRTEETGKVYEYMATGKPILALIHSYGAAAQVLANYGAARVIDRENVSGAAVALKELILGRAGCSAADDSAWVAGFERRRLTGRLAEVFDRVSASS